MAGVEVAEETSLPIGKKLGRPVDEQRAWWRSYWSEWSDRTFARWWRAWQILRDCGIDVDDAVTHSTRPNGSMSVAKFERYAEQQLMRAVMSRGAHD